jgi:membrane-bound serine protease (ClpP class)
MHFWIWAVLLLLLGACLAVMEIFFPSAGILGFLSVLAVLAAIVMGFWQDPITGILILLGAMFGLPTVVVLGFKYWPKTAMGRRVLLGPPTSDQVLPASDQKEYLKSLIGKIGQAKTKMLLSGAISIDGHTIDAVSESQPIEAGQAVQVVQVRGHGLVVRPVDVTPKPLPANPLEQAFDDPFDAPPADTL